MQSVGRRDEMSKFFVLGPNDTGGIAMVDMLLRGMALGSLLSMFAATLRSDYTGTPLWTFRIFCLAAVGFIVWGSGEISALVGPLRYAARILSAGGVGYFWLFAMTMFSSRPLRTMHVIPIAAMTVLAVPGPLLSPAVLMGSKIIYNMIEVLLIGHAMVEIWHNRDDDLVNARLALRAPFMAIIGATCLILTGFKFAGLLGFPHDWLGGVQAAITTLTALAVASAFMQERSRLFEQPFLKKPSGHGPARELRVADELTMQRLNQLIDDAAFWRQPGLTIGATAEKVGVPEYRLRQMINRNLGYRNFSDFLNERRVTVAKQELKDQEKARVQISTIAFDLGYASLGPFNKAFREATGMSPREWRSSVSNF
jgi:AraC-like DNA-binding protein